MKQDRILMLLLLKSQRHLFICILFALNFNCSSTDFVGKSQRGKASVPAPAVSGDDDSAVKDPQLPNTPPPPPAGSAPITQEFDLETYTSELDMVWVVDNSGSMEEEIEQIRLNFTRFTASLSEDINLKLALISGTASGFERFGLEMPKNLPTQVKHLQVDRYVHSYDALELTAYATCPSEASAENRLCGSDFVKYEQSNIIHGTAHNIKGTLQAFHRPNVKRIYVFVSDDNAMHIDSTEFQRRIAPYLQGSSYSVYGFVSIPDLSSCNTENPGLAYTKLANSTGGMVYDICQSDWSEHFNELTADVRKKVKSEFPLALTPNKILSVKINDFILSSSEYTLIGNIVHIKPRQEAISYVGKLVVIYE